MPKKREAENVQAIIAELSERSKRLREQAKKLDEESQALEQLIAKVKALSSSTPERPTR